MDITFEPFKGAQYVSPEEYVYRKARFSPVYREEDYQAERGKSEAAGRRYIQQAYSFISNNKGVTAEDFAGIQAQGSEYLKNAWGDAWTSTDFNKDLYESFTTSDERVAYLNARYATSKESATSIYKDIDKRLQSEIDKRAQQEVDTQLAAGLITADQRESAFASAKANITSAEGSAWMKDWVSKAREESLIFAGNADGLKMNTLDDKYFEYLQELNYKQALYENASGWDKFVDSSLNILHNMSIGFLANTGASIVKGFGGVGALIGGIFDQDVIDRYADWAGSWHYETPDFAYSAVQHDQGTLGKVLRVVDGVIQATEITLMSAIPYAGPVLFAGVALDNWGTYVPETEYTEGYWTDGIGSYKDADGHVNVGKAWGYTALKFAWEWGLEQVSNPFDGLFGAVSKPLNKVFDGKIGNKILNWVVNSATEAAQECLQDALGGITQAVVYGDVEGMKEAFKGLGETALISFLSAGIASGVTTTVLNKRQKLQVIRSVKNKFGVELTGREAGMLKSALEMGSAVAEKAFGKDFATKLEALRDSDIQFTSEEITDEKSVKQYNRWVAAKSGALQALAAKMGYEAFASAANLATKSDITAMSRAISYLTTADATETNAVFETAKKQEQSATTVINNAMATIDKRLDEINNQLKKRKGVTQEERAKLKEERAGLQASAAAIAKTATKQADGTWVLNDHFTDKAVAAKATDETRRVANKLREQGIVAGFFEPTGNTQVRMYMNQDGSVILNKAWIESTSLEEVVKQVTAARARIVFDAQLTKEERNGLISLTARIGKAESKTPADSVQTRPFEFNTSTGMFEVADTVAFEQDPLSPVSDVVGMLYNKSLRDAVWKSNKPLFKKIGALLKDWYKVQAKGVKNAPKLKELIGTKFEQSPAFVALVGNLVNAYDAQILKEGRGVTKAAAVSELAIKQETMDKLALKTNDPKDIAYNVPVNLSLSEAQTFKMQVVEDFLGNFGISIDTQSDFRKLLDINSYTGTVEVNGEQVEARQHVLNVLSNYNVIKYRTDGYWGAEGYYDKSPETITANFGSFMNEYLYATYGVMVNKITGQAFTVEDIQSFIDPDLLDAMLLSDKDYFRLYDIMNMNGRRRYGMQALRTEILVTPQMRQEGFALGNIAGKYGIAVQKGGYLRNALLHEIGHVLAMYAGFGQSLSTTYLKTLLKDAWLNNTEAVLNAYNYVFGLKDNAVRENKRAVVDTATNKAPLLTGGVNPTQVIDSLAEAIYTGFESAELSAQGERNAYGLENQIQAEFIWNETGGPTQTQPNLNYTAQQIVKVKASGIFSFLDGVTAAVGYFSYRDMRSFLTEQTQLGTVAASALQLADKPVKILADTKTNTNSIEWVETDNTIHTMQVSNVLLTPYTDTMVDNAILAAQNVAIDATAGDETKATARADAFFDYLSSAVLKRQAVGEFIDWLNTIEEVYPETRDFIAPMLETGDFSALMTLDGLNKMRNIPVFNVFNYGSHQYCTQLNNYLIKNFGVVIGPDGKLQTVYGTRSYAMLLRGYLEAPVFEDYWTDTEKEQARALGYTKLGQITMPARYVLKSDIDPARRGKLLSQRWKFEARDTLFGKPRPATSHGSTVPLEHRLVIPADDIVDPVTGAVTPRDLQLARWAYEYLVDGTAIPAEYRRALANFTRTVFHEFTHVLSMVTPVTLTTSGSYVNPVAIPGNADAEAFANFVSNTLGLSKYNLAVDFGNVSIPAYRILNQILYFSAAEERGAHYDSYIFNASNTRSQTKEFIRNYNITSHLSKDGYVVVWYQNEQRHRAVLPIATVASTVQDNLSKIDPLFELGYSVTDAILALSKLDAKELSAETKELLQQENVTLADFQQLITEGKFGSKLAENTLYKALGLDTAARDTATLRQDVKAKGKELRALTATERRKLFNKLVLQEKQVTPQYPAWTQAKLYSNKAAELVRNLYDMVAAGLVPAQVFDLFPPELTEIIQTGKIAGKPATLADINYMLDAGTIVSEDAKNVIVQCHPQFFKNENIKTWTQAAEFATVGLAYALNLPTGKAYQTLQDAINDGLKPFDVTPFERAEIIRQSGNAELAKQAEEAGLGINPLDKPKYTLYKNYNANLEKPVNAAHAITWILAKDLDFTIQAYEWLAQSMAMPSGLSPSQSEIAKTGSLELETTHKDQEGTVSQADRQTAQDYAAGKSSAVGRADAMSTESAALVDFDMSYAKDAKTGEYTFAKFKEYLTEKVRDILDENLGIPGLQTFQDNIANAANEINDRLAEDTDRDVADWAINAVQRIIDKQAAKTSADKTSKKHGLITTLRQELTELPAKVQAGDEDAAKRLKAAQKVVIENKTALIELYGQEVYDGLVTLANAASSTQQQKHNLSSNISVARKTTRNILTEAGANSAILDRVKAMFDTLDKETAGSLEQRSWLNSFWVLFNKLLKNKLHPKVKGSTLDSWKAQFQNIIDSRPEALKSEAADKAMLKLSALAASFEVKKSDVGEVVNLDAPTSWDEVKKAISEPVQKRQEVPTMPQSKEELTAQIKRDFIKSNPGISEIMTEAEIDKYVNDQAELELLKQQVKIPDHTQSYAAPQSAGVIEGTGATEAADKATRAAQTKQEVSEIAKKTKEQLKEELAEKRKIEKEAAKQERKAERAAEKKEKGQKPDREVKAGVSAETDQKGDYKRGTKLTQDIISYKFRDSVNSRVQFEQYSKGDAAYLLNEKENAQTFAASAEQWLIDNQSKITKLVGDDNATTKFLDYVESDPRLNSEERTNMMLALFQVRLQSQNLSIVERASQLIRDRVSNSGRVLSLWHQAGEGSNPIQAIRVEAMEFIAKKLSKPVSELTQKELEDNGLTTEALQVLNRLAPKVQQLRARNGRDARRELDTMLKEVADVMYPFLKRTETLNPFKQGLSPDQRKEVWSSLYAKVKAFRYLAMLGNIATLGRNEGGNWVAKGLSKLSRGVTGLVNKLAARYSKTGSDALAYKAGKIDATTQATIDTWWSSQSTEQYIGSLIGGSKYDADVSTQSVLALKGEAAKYYSFGNGKGAIFSRISRLVYGAMDSADRRFVLKEVKAITSQLIAANMTAKEIAEIPNAVKYAEDLRKQIADEQNLEGALLEKALGERLARQHFGDVLNKLNTYAEIAMTQAAETYYKNTNRLNELVKNLPLKAQEVINIFMPFVRMTTNTVIAAYKFSPFGLSRAIYRMVKYDPGKVTLTEAQKAAGLTEAAVKAQMQLQYLAAQFDVGRGVVGSLAWILGAILAALGIVGIDDEEEYLGVTLKLGDLRLRLDQLTPASLPLLSGAALVSASQNDNMMQAVNVICEASAINSILSPAGDLTDFSGVANSMQNYIYSYIPTVSKQIAKIIDPTQKSFSSNKSLSGAFKRTFEKIGAGIPGLSYLVPNKIDPYTGNDRAAYGKGGAGSMFLSTLNAISPLTLQWSRYSDIEKEAIRVGATTTGPSNTFIDPYTEEEVTLSGAELRQYQKLRAQIVNELVTILIASDAYKAATPAEKKRMLKRAYSQATTEAKQQFYAG
jgi:hypothetical protein